MGSESGSAAPGDTVDLRGPFDCDVENGFLDRRDEIEQALGAAALYLFDQHPAILKAHHAEMSHEQMITELNAEVAREISPIAKPREIHVVPELPKTRSGKIMRRLLRDVAEGRELGDTSTLVDAGVFEAIRAAK